MWVIIFIGLVIYFTTGIVVNVMDIYKFLKSKD